MARPVVWFSRARCTSCATKRMRYMVPHTCARIGGWDYTYPDGWRALRLVSQIEAGLELARRDRIGVEDEVAKKRSKKTA